MELADGKREITADFWYPSDKDIAVLNGDGGGFAHETAGVLRMQRHGMTGAKIASTLKIRGTQLADAMQTALDQEGIAHCAGVPIHDSGIPKYDYENGVQQ